MSTKTIIITAIVAALVLVVGVGSFFAGSAYGQQQANNIRSNFFNQRQGGGGNPNGQFGPNAQNGQGGQFGRPAAVGTIKSINGNLVQISQQDGSTVTVTVDAQTTIQKTDVGALSDLKPGERITVLSDQTGSNITARSIQLRAATAQ